jgi:hypothetical protein
VTDATVFIRVPDYRRLVPGGTREEGTPMTIENDRDTGAARS